MVIAQNWFRNRSDCWKQRYRGSAVVAVEGHWLVFGLSGRVGLGLWRVFVG